MWNQLRAAFGWGKGPGEAKRQQRAKRSRARLSLEPLEDRLALSTMGMDATSMAQSMPALSMPAIVNMEQQFLQNVAGFLSAEAQLVSPISPPLASLLQTEAQFVLSLLPASATSTGIHQYPYPGAGNITPHPMTSSAADPSTSTGIHIYPYPGASNITPHPW